MSNQEEHLRGRCFARDEDIHQGGPVWEEQVGGDGAEVTEETSASSNRSTGLLPERLQAVANPLQLESGDSAPETVYADVALKLGHSGSFCLPLLAQNRPFRTHSETSSATENRCRGFASNLAPSPYAFRSRGMPS